MATTWQVEVLIPATEPVDPYRYGWRSVRRADARGLATVEQEPLTLLDVLHPEEGDVIVQSDSHERRTRYLADVLNAQLAAVPGAVVVQDVRVDWGNPDIRPHGPDIVVLLDMGERRDWSTVPVASLGARPALVIEVTSPSTAVLDRDVKLSQYETLGVPLYIIVDTVVGAVEAAPRLVGYQLVAGRYQALAPDDDGRLWLAVAQIWLAVREGDIICFDEAGQRLGDYTAEREARRLAEEERDAAAAQVRALEAELHRLRGQ